MIIQAIALFVPFVAVQVILLVKLAAVTTNVSTPGAPDFTRGQLAVGQRTL